MRRLSGPALTLALLAAVPAGAGPELGSPAVTRLWRQVPGGRVPACTAVYVRDPWDRLPAGAVWLLTARHCTTEGRWFVGREAPDEPLPPVAAADEPQAPATPDIAVARAGGERTALTLAERMPRHGSVWVHGFPFGVEHLTAARIRGDSPRRPGSVELKVVVGPMTEVGPGVSGSPVIDAAGRLIGVLWGLRAEDERAYTALVTPVEALRALLRRLPAGSDSRRRPAR